MQKPNRNFYLRLACMLLGVFFMGFFLSLLIWTDFGVDPCSSLNLALSALSGLSFGTCQLVMNLVLLAIVVVWDRHMIGLGTVANMVLVGYISDFFTFLWRRFLPPSGEGALPLRLFLFAAGLIGFVIAAAAYMTAEQGVSPYDAIPMLLARKLKNVSFRTVRMCWDFSVTVLTLLLGGSIGLVTVGIVLTLGPIVGKVGRIFSEKIYKNKTPAQRLFHRTGSMC